MRDYCNGLKGERKEIKGFAGKKGQRKQIHCFEMKRPIRSNYLMKREQGPTNAPLFEEGDHFCTQDYAPTHPPNHQPPSSSYSSCNIYVKTFTPECCSSFTTIHSKASFQPFIPFNFRNQTTRHLVKQMARQVVIQVARQVVQQVARQVVQQVIIQVVRH